MVATVTVTDATAAGYWQVLPTDGAILGSSSNLNINTVDQTSSNQVVIPVGADGSITIFVQAGGHVIVDIAGTFTGPDDPDSTLGLFTPVTLARSLLRSLRPRPHQERNAPHPRWGATALRLARAV